MECWEGGRIERVLPVSCGLVCSVCVSVSTMTMLTLWWLLTLMQMNPTTAGKLSFILLFLLLFLFGEKCRRYIVCVPSNVFSHLPRPAPGPFCVKHMYHVLVTTVSESHAFSLVDA